MASLHLLSLLMPQQQRAAQGWGSRFSRCNHGYSTVMGTEFTVVPRGGDQLHGNTVGVGRFVVVVPRSWSSNFQCDHGLDCKVAEFDM